MMGGSTDPEALAAYEEGRRAFAARDLDGAHAAFQRAHQRDGRDPRIMSWYGVTLVLVERNSNLGVQLCDQSLRVLGKDPELLLNLARVHLALGQRERVVQVVTRGLELFPRDARFRAARAALGARRQPVIPFLSREHPWNRGLGRLRHRLLDRGPAYELSPVALGDPNPALPPGNRS